MKTNIILVQEELTTEQESLVALMLEAFGKGDQTYVATANPEDICDLADQLTSEDPEGVSIGYALTILEDGINLRIMAKEELAEVMQYSFYKTTEEKADADIS